MLKDFFQINQQSITQCEIGKNLLAQKTTLLKCKYSEYQPRKSFLHD